MTSGSPAGVVRVLTACRAARVRQLMALVLGLLILVGLAGSSVLASRAAADAAAEQHLADQKAVVNGAARNIAPPSTPEAIKQMADAVAALAGVTERTTSAELPAAMSRIAAIFPGSAAASYDAKSRALLAESPTWNPALDDVIRREVFPHLVEGRIQYSRVIGTPTGAYTVTVLQLRGWGSKELRNFALGAPLDNVQATLASQAGSSGTVMVIDQNGVVVSAIDKAVLGTRLPWWVQHVAAAGDAEGASRIMIDGVDTQLISKSVPGSARWLVMRAPAAEFDAATRGKSQAIELAIVLLVAIAGGLLILNSYRQSRVASRSEARSRALLEDTGDVVLLVRDGAVTFAGGGWHASNLHEIVGQPLHSVFAGALSPALDTSTSSGAKARFDTQVTLPDGSHHWVEVTVANRSEDPAVRGLVISLHDVSERRAMQQQLHFEATHDSLTGLVNRSQFNELANQALARHRRDGGRAAIMYIDLDRFKPINDRHGHEAGDNVLKVIGSRLRDAVRDHDVVARLGGDEFAVLLDGATPDEAQAILERVNGSAQEPILVAPGQRERVGLSVGMSYAIAGNADTESLLRDADLMMYDVKAAHHARVAVPATREGTEALGI